MVSVTWWMRIVGVLYLFVAVVSIGPRIPIKAEGPEGVLERAASGDAIARFVLDTWTMFGLYMGAVGVSLLVGGIGIDVYKLTRGYRRAPSIAWIVVHSAVILTGLLAVGQI